jgi:tetratricopeptide (TPR) repeat protein
MYNAGDYDGAAVEFNKAIAKDSKGEYPDAKDWLVKSYIGKGKKDYEANNIHAAVVDFGKARDEAVRLQVTAALLDEATSLYNKAVAESKARAAEALALLKKAEDAFKAGDFDGAERLANQAAQKDPESVEVRGFQQEVADMKVKIADAQNLMNDANAMLDRPDCDMKTAETARKNFDQAKLLYSPYAAPGADKGIKRASDKIAEIRLNAAKMFNDGLDCIKKEEWDKAIECFSECAKLDYTYEDRAGEQITKVQNMQAAESNYAASMAKAQAKPIEDITTVPEAEEVINLCGEAISAYADFDNTVAAAKTKDAVALKTLADKKRVDLLKAAEDSYNKGMDHKRKKEFVDAAEDFNNCLLIQPGHEQATAELADINESLQQQESVQVLLDEGENLLKQNKPYDAKAKFQEANHADPGNAKAADGLARANAMIDAVKKDAAALAKSAEQKVALKNYDGALADYDKAILKDPDNKTYPKRRADVLNMLVGAWVQAGQQYEKDGKWVLAQKEYEKALKYDKKYQKDIDRVRNEMQVEVLVLQGDSLMKKSNFSEAAQSYNKALAITLRKAWVQAKLAAALGKMKESADAAWTAGDHEGSLKQMDDILAIDPAYDAVKATADAHRAVLDKASESYDQALAAIDEKRLVAAKALLEGIAKDMPKYQDSDTLLKNINAKLVTAKASYDRGKKYESEAAAAGTVAAKLSKYELAEGQYDKVVDVVVDYMDAAALSANLKGARDGYDNAEALLAQKKLLDAQKLYKDVDKLYKGFADVTAKLAKIQDDLDECEVLYKRGVDYQKQQKWQLAKERYMAVLDLIDDYKDVKTRLAECKKQLGE